MKAIRWPLLVITFGLLVWLTTTLFARSRQLPETRLEPAGSTAETTDQGRKSESKSGSGDSPLSTFTPSPSLETKPVLLDLPTKTLMLNCSRGSETFSGLGREADFTTLDDYLIKAPVLHGGIEGTRELLLQSLELSNSTGDKIRVRFVPRNGTSLEHPETEVFGVDSDGLPEMIPFPRELEGLSTIDQLAKLRTEFGTLDFDQEIVAYRWPNRASGTVSFRNGQIEEMQMYFENHGSMGCVIVGSSATCKCLKPAQ